MSDRQKVPGALNDLRSYGWTRNNTISQSVDAMHALAKMTRTGHSQLMVVDGDQLVGVVMLKDMLRFLSLKLNLRRGFPEI